MSIKSQYNDELRYVEYAVEKYSRTLFRISYSILENEHDAEDAVQEAFIRYMTKSPLFRDSEHEKAWLIRVTTNISKNMARFRMHQAQSSILQLNDIGVAEDDKGVIEAVMHLPVKYRTVLDLYYIEGYKANEIASILGISAAAVRKRLQYGRTLLKKELERSGL